MTQTRPRARLAWLAAALLAVALLIAACGGAPAPAATAVPPATTAPATQPAATSAPGTGPVEQLDLPAGVDANGNFYRGDPNAPVKMEEWSDFQ